MESSGTGLVSSSSQYLNQTLFLLNTGITTVNMEPMARILNELIGTEYIIVSNITDKDKAQKYPKLKVKKDFGYILTDMLMEQLIQKKNEHKCEYLLLTNGDNLYNKDLFSATYPYMVNKTGAIGFYFISSHCQPAHHYVSRKGCNTEFFTEFEQGRVDLGAVLIRVDAIKFTNARLVTHTFRAHPNGLWGQYYVADGKFITTITDTIYKSAIVPQILFHKQ